MTPTREIALDTLLQIETEGSYSNLALQAALRKHALSSPDRHFVTQLVYGTIQYQRLLDEMLQPFLKQPVAKLKPWVKQLLRISVYQLLFLERVPAFAAIHEAVSIAGRRGGKLRGFVNAVLRNIQRSDRFKQKEDLLNPANASTAEQIAALTSHPTWMIEEWEWDFGLAQAKSIAISNNERPYLTVRVNARKMSRDRFLQELAQEGLPVEPSPVSPYGVRLLEGIDIAGWKWFKNGTVTVQDESAMLVAPVVAPSAGLRVLDACAAPGGKTTHLAELANDEAEIVAADLYEHKIGLIAGAAQRLGLQHIQAAVMDMSQPAEDLRQFDRILLDAPCSGLGVIRRKPDLKWRKKPEEMAGLAQVQRSLLESCWKLLRPQGVLVYSTCTIRTAENEQMISRFCMEQPDARVEDVRQWLPANVAGRVRVSPHGIAILPDHFGSDGFFISRLSKM